MARTKEWSLKPDKIKRGEKGPCLNPERTDCNALQRGVRVQRPLASQTAYRGIRSTQQITGSVEKQPGPARVYRARYLERFKLRIAIDFALVTVGNTFLYSRATDFRSTQCAVRNTALQTPSSAVTARIQPTNVRHLLYRRSEEHARNCQSQEKRSPFWRAALVLKAPSAHLSCPPVKESFCNNYIPNSDPLRWTGFNANYLQGTKGMLHCAPGHWATLGPGWWPL